MKTKRAAKKDTKPFRSVVIALPEPMGVPGNSNAIGPIVSIEILAGNHADGEFDLVYWADDGKGDDGGGTTSYGSLVAMCKEHELPIDKIMNLIAVALVDARGVEI